jgi:AcrR family transcriptional regulator
MLMSDREKMPRLDKVRPREQLLDAAEAVFGDAGLKGATTKEIARVAGIHETTLFRHFSSKEDLFLAVVKKGMDEAAELFQDNFSYSGDIQHDLRRFAKIYCEHIRGREPMIRVCLSTMNILPEEAKEIFQVTNIPTLRALATCLQEAQAQGVVRKDLEPYQVAQAFTGTLMMYLLKQSVLKSPYSEADYFETLIELFLHGMHPLDNKIKGASVDE